MGCLLPSLQHLVSTFSLEESEHKPLWSEKQRAPLHPTLLIQTEGGRMASQPGCSMGVSEWLWGETQKQTKLCQLPRIYVDVQVTFAIGSQVSLLSKSPSIWGSEWTKYTQCPFCHFYSIQSFLTLRPLPVLIPLQWPLSSFHLWSPGKLLLRLKT